MKTKLPKTNKKKIPKTVIVITIVAQFALASLLSLTLVVHGPFDTLRKSIIGAAMTTYDHQYIAEMLFSQKQINEVQNLGVSSKAKSQDISQVKPKNYDNPNILLEEISSKDGSYNGYLMEISDPLRVGLAYTDNLGKVGAYTSKMAQEHGAVAAINGGGFGDSEWAGTGAIPSNFIIVDGILKWKDPSQSDNAKCDVIALNANGQLIVGRRSINDLLGMDVKVMSAVTLPNYPALVVDGKGTFKNASAASKYSWHPRTAIGQKADGTIIMLVLDGRQMSGGVLMKGASLYDVQKIMLDHGAVTAANLDGGNSTTMYYNGQVINSPSGELGERTVSTAFYVKK
jgi:exopolysaccharide biosynthesis protein